MSSKLSEYLQDISTNPQKLAAFQNNPSDAMTKAGLDDEEKSAILSKNPQTISNLIKKKGGGGGGGTTVVVVVIVAAAKAS